MVNPINSGLLMGLGLFLLVLSPVIIAIYTVITGTWGVLGAILASIGTLMFINFYGITDNFKGGKHETNHNRLIGLLVGPALVILGFYLMINY